MPWSRKSRAIHLLPLWAVRPVQSLSACTRVHFTYVKCGRSKRQQCCQLVTTVQEGWVSPTHGLDGRGKLRHPSEFDPRTVQPAASRYTDCATPARIISSFVSMTVQPAASRYTDCATPARIISSFVSMKSNFMFCGNYLEKCKTCGGMWHKMWHKIQNFIPIDLLLTQPKF